MHVYLYFIFLLKKYNRAITTELQQVGIHSRLTLGTFTVSRSFEVVVASADHRGRD